MPPFFPPTNPRTFALAAAALVALSCSGDDTGAGADTSTSRNPDQYEPEPNAPNVGGGGGGGMGGNGASGSPADDGMRDNADAGAHNGSDAGAMPADTPPADAGSEPSCPDTTALQPGDSMHSVQVGGTTREYLVHVPPGYTGDEPVPLLVDWHPLLSSAQFQRDNSGYAEVADREGFIVAYPDGIDDAWNIGPCCTQSRDVDDLGFALALVDKIEREACIDTKRIYAAGFSMGGGMSHFLACRAADTFAAVAPAAFDLIEEMECDPARPISVISFRGTADFIVPYSGGASSPPTPYPLPEIHFLGAEGTFERWAELNACSGTPESLSDGCESYSECAGGVEVTLCTTQGGGHTTGDAEFGWSRLQSYSLPEQDS